jgi:multidrug efflux pump subunit AcrB
MTAFSFILGVVPLVIATGAGAESRRSIGVCVVYGLAASTLLSLVIVPTFYALLVTVRDRLWGAPDAPAAEVPSGHGHGH